MKLVIAEKPMLARAILDAIDGTAEKHTGYAVKGEYAVVSAFGHLLTLKEPEDYDEARYRRWTLAALPIYFEDWGKKPGPGKEERLNLIGNLLKNAQEVIHAGDPDDEGQYLIDEILQWFHYEGPVWRLATGDTTEAALRKALASMQPNARFESAGWSAHARSVADIMVGFNFSRYFSLTNAHVKMLTVGRVQTPTLGLVVARDMAIENHARQAFYTVTADLALAGQSVTARYEPAKDDPSLEDGRITDGGYAGDIASALMGAHFDAVRVSVKALEEQPPLPFNLVKLQTYCSQKFGYDPSETLAITQTLRDTHNAITYNRSDCQYLSEEQYKLSPATVKTVLSNLSGDPAGNVFARLPLDTTLHSRAFDDDSITAHTAIIPQNRRFDIGKLSERERNVYLAIVKYYMAQFLPAAQKQRTTLEVPAEGGTLKAASTKTQKKGYLVLIRPEARRDDDAPEEEESALSLIPAGTYGADCTATHVDEKETKAPPRYTKASLNEDMTRIARYVTDPKAKALLLAKDKEKKGENGSIGTSATRAGIIDALEERGFIESRGKQIRSTQLGRELCRILPDELKKPDMTGLWWAVQESIQEGTLPWTALTDSVLDMIKKVIKTRYPKVDAYHVPPEMRRGQLLLGTCPRCGEDVIEGKTAFGCNGYRHGCQFTIRKQAKAGMMSHVEVTADMVHDLLSGGWQDMPTPEETDSKSLPCVRGGGPASLAVGLSPDEVAPQKPSPFIGEGGPLAVDEVENLSSRVSGNSVTQAPPDDFLPTPRSRCTVNAVPVRRLWSEGKKRTYPGLICLVDEGPGSPYGASFMLRDIIHDPPKSLGKCPRCGADVIEGKNGYGCSAYQTGCKFVIWKKAKSGMMSRCRVTRGMVRTLLKSPWVPEERPDEQGIPQPTGRNRTEATVHMRRLYSEAKSTFYTGDVFLTDEGPASPYGASFGLAAVTNDALGKCPRCGADVTEGRLGFGCTRYQEGCKFSIWKNSKQKFLSGVTFTAADAKKFLAGKTVKKRRLLDRRGQQFTAELVMIEEPDNPYGPVFRVVEGTIVPKEEGAVIRMETVSLAEPSDSATNN